MMYQWRFYRDRALAQPVDQGYHARGIQWERLPTFPNVRPRVGPYFTDIGWWLGSPRRSDHTFKV